MNHNKQMSLLAKLAESAIEVANQNMTDSDVESDPENDELINTLAKFIAEHIPGGGNVEDVIAQAGE